MNRSIHMVHLSVVLVATALIVLLVPWIQTATNNLEVSAVCAFLDPFPICEPSNV